MRYFGLKLRELRTKYGFTQKELAKKLDISPSAVGMYEQGRREPDFRILGQICRIFSTHTNVFIEKDNIICELKDLMESFLHNLEISEISVNKNLVHGENKNKIIKFMKGQIRILINQIYSNYK